MTIKIQQCDLDRAKPFMDRYLDGSEFCDDRNDLAEAFAKHRIEALEDAAKIARVTQSCALSNLGHGAHIATAIHNAAHKGGKDE